MTELVSSLSALPVSIKMGWIILIAWSLLQVRWYRRGRTAATPVYQPATPRYAPERPQLPPWPEHPAAVGPLPAESAATPGSVLGLT